MKSSNHPFPVLISTALSVAALQVGVARASEPPATPSPAAATTKEVPFLSCTLSSLDDKERQRHGELLARLRIAITERQELPDGYAFRLGAGFSLTELAEWIALERRCCAFFGFTVESKPGEDDLWLHLTGGGDVKAFIRAVVLAEDAGRPAASP